LLSHACASSHPRAAGSGDARMSFSRGRRPTLEYERPKSAVPTRSVVDPRLVLKLPPPAPKPAPIIAHGLRTFGGIRREPPGASAAPGASPWGTPDLPDHPRPFSAVPRTRRARPPPVGGTDKSRGVRDEYRRYVLRVSQIPLTVFQAPL